MLRPVHILILSPASDLSLSDLHGYVFQLPAVGQILRAGMFSRDAYVCIPTCHAMFSRGSLCVIGGVCGNLVMGAGQVEFGSVQGANYPVAFCLFSIGDSAWITAESVVCIGATDEAGFVLLLVELCDKDALTAHDMWVF